MADADLVAVHIAHDLSLYLLNILLVNKTRFVAMPPLYRIDIGKEVYTP